MAASLYGFMKMVDQAYKGLDVLADEFVGARNVANTRMGAAPAVRDEISEVTGKLVTMAVAGKSWWTACKRLHPDDIKRVEEPIEGSVRKQVSQDRGPAKREQ